MFLFLFWATFIGIGTWVFKTRQYWKLIENNDSCHYTHMSFKTDETKVLNDEWWNDPSQSNLVGNLYHQSND